MPTRFYTDTAMLVLCLVRAGQGIFYYYNRHCEALDTRVGAVAISTDKKGNIPPEQSE